MSPAPRVLFVGIDAGDRDLILEWSRAGWLPNLRSLLERAAWTSTNNPIGLYVGAVWPSFYTATSPARHARYCYSQLRSGTYDLVEPSPTDVRRPPFWEELGRAGRRVAIVDVPKTFPSEGLNGIQLCDWGTHDPDHGYSSWPPEFAPEIAERFGNPLQKCDAAGRDLEGLRALRDRLAARAATRGELARELLEREAWDFFGVVFSESHCAGHQLWHVRDPGHPRHDPVLRRELGDPMRDVYAAIDAALGRILELAGSQTALFVLASHGMGPHYDGTFLLAQILSRLREASVSGLRLRTGDWLARAWDLAPMPVRRFLSPLRTRTRERLGQAFPTAGVEGSLPFWEVPNNDVYGGIRINRVGREPRGSVRPGAELDALCDLLARELGELVNLETGRPLVKRVLRSRDVYQGEHLDELPDLLVEWDRESPVRRIHSPRLGTLEGEFRGKRTGDHKPDGLLIARGPAIRPGQLDRSVSVMDVAPTMAAVLDVQLPGVDGGRIPELVRAE